MPKITSITDLIIFDKKKVLLLFMSPPMLKQQNGIVERKNRHLLDQARAIFFQNKIPKKNWGEAVLTASYVINHLPSSVFASKSSMEVLSSFYVDVSTYCNLIPRRFWCKSFVYIHSDCRGKLDPRALKCVFI
jgi:hypothetical protein